MTEERRQITGHILACGTQIMWGATFVSTKVLLNYFLPAEVLFTRAVLARECDLSAIRRAARPPTTRCTR